MVRVALAGFRWPLDPALAAGRDETTLARTLYPTPLRTDPATGAVVAGLCSAWQASPDFRVWRFTCKAAPSIAAGLRRVARLHDARLNWIFRDARIEAPDGMSLVVRLPFSWRRFPYVLTAVGAAPRSVPGPFRLESGSANRVVVRRPGLTVVFRRLDPVVAVREFRRGNLDEAPVPLGDIVALKARLGNAVRARTLLGVDLVVFRGFDSELRRVYWQTADRGDYEGLVPEFTGSSAFGLVGTGKADPARYRRALNAIKSLPRVAVRFALPTDRVLRFGARLLWAEWRDVGLGPQLVARPSGAFDASLVRLVSAYPQEEAIPAELVLRGDVGARDDLLRALAVTRQHSWLERFDEKVRDSAVVIPVAWVVDARLVSSRLDGWREDILGDVDYASVRSRASTRRP